MEPPASLHSSLSRLIRSSFPWILQRKYFYLPFFKSRSYHQNPLFQNNLHRLLQLYNPIRNLSIWGLIHEEFPLGPKRVCSHCQLFWWDIHKWSHQFFSGRVKFFEKYGSLLLYLYSLIKEYPFIAFKKTKFLAVELFSIYVSVSFCKFETYPFIK